MHGFALLQISAFGKSAGKALTAAIGKLPDRIGRATTVRGRTVMQVGPRHYWIVAPDEPDLAAQSGNDLIVTRLSHSRVRICLKGEPARRVLAKGIPLDFHPDAFGPETFAMTGLHHMPLLVHCTAPDRFELYAMRTFAVSVWEWLTDAAMEYAEGNWTP
jgi:sarcosine oxidase subunit gamma